MDNNPANNLLKELEFHHTGIVVENIIQSLEHYSVLFGRENISEPVFISSQKVKVCFIKNGENSYLELVEPVEENSIIYNLLKKKTSYYHVAYRVENIYTVIDKLEKLNYKALQPFNSEVFEGKLCVFLYTPEAALIELIQK